MTFTDVSGPSLLSRAGPGVKLQNRADFKDRAGVGEGKGGERGGRRLH